MVTVKNLLKTFVSKDEKVTALNNVTLSTPPNRILTLLGPSGCGKTTLLRCIAGLESPDSGEIVIGDDVVWSKDKGISLPPERRGIGMVFQSYAIWPHMTVFGNVAYPLEIRKVPKPEIEARVKKILELVQLNGFENRLATKLSGGQQQRVALARALVAEPKVILFDEPLSNLDAKLRESTRQELRHFLTELAISAIYVTHDQMEALTISDEIAVMRAGSIVERGTPQDIYLRSNNPFVVDFIGRANFLKATITGYKDDTHAVVSCAMGNIVCSAPPRLPVGTEVTIYTRPESFEMAPHVSDASDAPDASAPSQSPVENVFEGTITSLLFAGEAHEAQVSVGGASILVRIKSHNPLRKGDRVRLRIDSEWCRALDPAEEA
ncbi:MAG: ABC transporter ATP-binding protein [Bacillota bacterium]|jgi:iron(III) transport system ATP-binding protein|nr:ABC transporter ATP-binding protein [Bacillota bacterium]